MNLNVTNFTVSATLQGNPFAGEVRFTDGKTYTWIRRDGEATTFIRWHGPMGTAEHGFAAPRRAAKLDPLLRAAWRREAPSKARKAPSGATVRPVGRVGHNVLAGTYQRKADLRMWPIPLPTGQNKDQLRQELARLGLSRA